jgi:hypothetical protein
MDGEKTFCVLEQGGYLNEQITEEHKNQFNTEFSDFYRLNFKTKEDPNAFISGIGTTHPEGRNLLYHHVPKKYDYYVFIDDDISFHDKNISNKIHELLNEYKPLSGTFYDPVNQWHSPNNLVSKEVKPIVHFDLAVQIYSSSCAEALLPYPYHSSDIPRMYQYIIHSLYPKKQMMFFDVHIENTENRDQDLLKFDESNPPNKEVHKLCKKDFWNSYHKSGSGWKHFAKSKNLSLMDDEVSKDEVILSLQDFDKVLDINSDMFNKRKSVY